jgi:hypothetical protein
MKPQAAYLYDIECILEGRGGYGEQARFFTVTLQLKMPFLGRALLDRGNNIRHLVR